MTTSVTPAVERIKIPHGLALLAHQKATIEARLQGYRWRVACDHRQSGKDLTALVDLATAAVSEPGTYAYIGPTYSMVRNIAWDGVRASDGRPYLSVIPAELIADKNEAELSLMVRTRHTDKLSRILFLSGDNADRLRGLPLKGVVLTEFAQFEGPGVLDVVRPALNASGGWLLVISTPLGIGNHFHSLFSMAKASPDWWTASRTIEDTTYLDGRPMVAKADVERELREGQREDWVQQEYYCRFVAGLIASIFGDVLTRAESDGRILDLPQRLDRPTIVAFDIGVDNPTVAVWIQPHSHGEWLDIVDVEAWQGLSIEGIIGRVREKGYGLREWIGPHDFKQRHITAAGAGGQALSPLTVASRLGVKFQVAPKLEVADGLDAVRRMFSRFRFDRKRCARLLEALSEYQRVWNPQDKRYSNKPRHNWASDYCDAVRTFATGYRDRDEDAGRHPRQTHAKTSLTDNTGGYSFH